MPISFNQIPSNIRVPLAYIEFDNSRAVLGTPDIPHKILVIGQRLAAGTVAAAVPTRITSAADAEGYFGRGSMLAEMLAALKAANRHTECWAIALDDDGAGVPADGTITITGPATGSGTIALMIGGKRVRVAVTAGDTANAIATATAAAINADTSLPVTAAVNGVVLNQVDVTCRWDGETGNAIDMRHSYYQGEALPAGLAVAIVALSGGTANPDIADAIAVFGDEWWNTIVMPYTDAANLTALATELVDRWGPTRMMDAMAYAAYRGTHAATQTFGDGRNDHLISIMGTNESPQPPYIWAAVNAGVAADSLSIDPARPLQTLVLTNLLAPAVDKRWNLEERNLHLYDGISTFFVDGGGRVCIERQVTTYQENAYGVADPSYLDVNTPATLAYIRYATRARITQKFPRHKLADDGTRFGAGQAIVTPSTIRAELIVLFRELEEQGLVENFDQYEADLIVERDADDRNRINVLSSPDLVNQFRIYAERTAFIV